MMRTVTGTGVPRAGTAGAGEMAQSVELLPHMLEEQNSNSRIHVLKAVVADL